MPINVEQFASAGFARADWGVVVDGYFNGTTGTALANGADAGLSQLIGADNMTLQPSAPNRVNIPGDDDSQAVFLFNPTELPSGNLVVGVFDANFASTPQGSKVYADGDWDVPVLGISDVEFEDLVLITHSQAKSKHSGKAGSGWMVKIYPAINSLALGDAGLTNQGATNFTHALIANKFATLPWGAALSDSDNGALQATVYGPFFSENRIALHKFVRDGSTTTFTLPKTPAAANGNKVKLWNNGTALAYTTDYTVNTSTRVVTLAAAGTAGHIVQVRYEWM